MPSAHTRSQTPRSASSTLATFTDVEKLEAKQNLRLAGWLAGLTGDDQFICPTCRVSHVGDSFVLRTDQGSWKCFKSDTRGDAISIVQQEYGLSFPDAVNVLLGRPPRRGLTKPLRPVPAVLPDIPSKASFVATVDSEVYAAVRDFSGEAGVVAAQEYYGRWHIAPGAVSEAGSAVVLDTRAMERELTKRFGIERLKASGLVTVTRHGKDYFLCNRDYPVIEAHITPAGKIAGMQFRPSPQQMVKVQAHKSWKKRRDAFLDPHMGPIREWEARQLQAREKGEEFSEPKPQLELPEYPEEKIPYVPPFLSLNGAGPDSLVGCGLVRLWAAPAGSEVVVVEGFKDLLAARTMGREAFGIPGTGGMPSAKVCEVLKRHKLLVALDGDAAGDKSRMKVVQYFRDQGIEAEKSWMPPGLDVTDMLVQKFAHAGCSCATCTEWRASHPS